MRPPIAFAGTPDPIRVSLILRRWRKREEADDGVLIHNLGRIRQAVGMEFDRDAVKAALIKLVARGLVEAVDCTNGVYWRSTGPDRLELRKAKR